MKRISEYGCIKNTSSIKINKPFSVHNKKNQIKKMPVGGRAVGKTGYSTGLSSNGKIFFPVKTLFNQKWRLQMFS